MSLVLLAAYLAVKLTGYTGWCALGLARLGTRPVALRMAALFGLVRLLMGAALGALLTGALLWGAPAQNRLGFSIPVFIASLAVLRWFEWGLMASLLARRFTVVGWLATGAPVWRLGGVAVSFLTDAAAVFTIGALGVIPC